MDGRRDANSDGRRDAIWEPRRSDIRRSEGRRLDSGENGGEFMILDKVGYVSYILNGDPSNLPTISNLLWMAEVMGELR